MRDVERLEEMKHLISVGINQHLGIICNEIKGEPVEYYVDAIDRIIQRLGPYEPGEIIRVNNNPQSNVYTQRKFICKDEGGVWCQEHVASHGQLAKWWSRHKPISKTKTLDVPVEILEKAKQIVEDCENWAGVGVVPNEPLKWLAEQAEGDDACD